MRTSSTVTAAIPKGMGIVPEDDGATMSEPNNDSPGLQFDKVKRKQQYQLVADEIASVLHGDDEEDDQEEDSDYEDADEDDDKPEHDEDSDSNDDVPVTNALPIGPSLTNLRHSRKSSASTMTSKDLRRTSFPTQRRPVGELRTDTSLAAAGTNPNTTMRRRKRIRRQRPPQPFLIKDAEFNSSGGSYGLFDFGGDGMKKQHHHPLFQPASIYAKTYHPSMLFTPIMVFLSMTFVLLVVVRILVSLVTRTIGMTMIMAVALAILQECLQRPIQFLSRIHHHPCRMSIGLAMVGNLLRHHGRSMAQELWNQVTDVFMLLLLSSRTNTAAASSMISAAATEAEESDFYSYYLCPKGMILWLLLPCMEGYVGGLIIGYSWRMCFGTASDPTKLTNWIVHRLWKGLIQRSYISCLRSVRQRRRKLRQRQQEEASLNKYDRECMICLEPFLESTAATSAGEMQVHQAGESRQYLPCLHGFHGKCLMQWLHVKSTCPICRVHVPSTTVATLANITHWSPPNHHPMRTHPAIHEPLYSIDEG